MRSLATWGWRLATATLAAGLSLHPALAVEPGVDIASPRVAISTVDSSFLFKPANLVVEQGDYVRWVNASAGASHTTTSGSGCAGDGRWSGGLGPGEQFTRQFSDPPANYPYFCIPHCGLNMVGSVVVTTRIVLAAEDSQGSLVLSWTGGGGLYRVFRSSEPAFKALSTQVFTPQGGDTGTSFSDAELPPPGGAFFYLAMNKF